MFTRGVEMSINLLFQSLRPPIIFVSHFYTFILSLENENLRKDRLENDEKMRGNTGDCGQFTTNHPAPKSNRKRVASATQT